MLPQENCTLKSVGASAAATDDSDAWDDAEAAATEAAGGGSAGVWQGGTRAYYQEKRQRTRDGSDERLLVQRTLIVAAHDPPVEWASEQAVTFALDGGPDETGVVRHVERRPLAAAGMAETVRLTFEDV